MSEKKAFHNIIDGQVQASASGATMDIINPSTGAVYATAPMSDEHDVDLACQASARAFEKWRWTTPGERQNALLKLAEPSRRNPALESTHAAAPGEAFSFLTEREIEILSALNAGESNKEIARTLQLAPETVKWHLKNVMRKLRANSREEAVQNASTLGLNLIEVAPHD